MFRKMWLFPTTLLLLSIVVFSFTSAGASAKTVQKNPRTALSAPGNENWLPGYFSGLDNLEEVNVDHVAVTIDGRVYMAGRFTFAGSHQQANVIYRQNGQWLPLFLPAPFQDTTRVIVGVMETYDSPNLYLQVKHPSNDTTLLIWNGSTWADLNIIHNFSQFLGIDNAGTPYMVEHTFGSFEAVIKRWDGTSWVYFATAQTPPTHQVEDGRPPTPPDPRVYAVAQDTQNNLYFGGAFTHINGLPINNLAKWDGTNWSAVGSGLNQVNALVALPNGLVFAGGVDTLGYIHNGVWHPFSFGGSVYTIEADNLGQIYIGGVLGVINGEPMTLVAQWNGVTWTNMNWGFPDFGSGGVSSLEVGNQNRVYAAGELLTAVGQPLRHAAVWDGTSWDTLGELTGQGINGAFDVNAWSVAIEDLATTAEGEIYAGGYFQAAGDETAYAIAKWDGTDWSPLGGGIGCHISCRYGYKYGLVEAMDVALSGNLYVAGSFTAAGNIPARNVARWDGTAWSAVGDTSFFLYYDFPTSLAVDHNEHVYVPVSVGENLDEVKKWNGSTWSTLGPAVQHVITLSTDKNGTVYRVIIQDEAKIVSYWNGSEWVQVGSEVPGYVGQILFGEDNTLYLIGGFAAESNRLYSAMSFDGTNWVPFGASQLESSGGATAGVFDEAGVLYVVGASSGKTARWDGVSWSSLGTGLTALSVLEANSLALDHQGNLFIGGQFTKAGPHHARHIAVWVAGDGACGLGSGGTHKLYAGEHEVTVEVTTAGTLDCVSLQRHQTNHPAATEGQQVGSWWELVGVDANGEPATGFTVNLTFPSAFAPVSANGKLCLQTETGWDCAADAVNGQRVTRQGVTSFGAVTIDAHMFYQFVPVILR